jgi:hypothetical protein
MSKFKVHVAAKKDAILAEKSAVSNKGRASGAFLL